MTNDFKRGDTITIAKAAELLAVRWHRNCDDKRSAKDRARKRIVAAAKNEILPSPDGGKSFLVEKFVGWARSLTLDGVSMDDKFKGFPADITISGTATVEITAEFWMVSQIPAPEVLAPTEWVDALKRANQKWAECQRENERLRAENEHLRPLADRYEANRKSNQESAKKPRSRAEKEE